MPLSGATLKQLVAALSVHRGEIDSLLLGVHKSVKPFFREP